MEQEYKFIFPGTREDFLNKLKPFPNNYEEYYYFAGYIVDLRDNEIRFGVARGGHSGGYWFNPTIMEIGGRMEFRGTIRRVGLEDNRSPKQKLADRMEKIMLMILFWPVLLPIMLYIRVNLFVRKIRKSKEPKEKTPEDGLFDLMVNFLGCTRESITN